METGVLTYRYTLETQLLPSIAAMTMMIQYAINSDTWMAFIYMYVSVPSLLTYTVQLERKEPRADLWRSIAHAKIPAVMMMGQSPPPLSLSYATDHC